MIVNKRKEEHDGKKSDERKAKFTAFIGLTNLAWIMLRFMHLAFKLIVQQLHLVFQQRELPLEPSP